MSGEHTEVTSQAPVHKSAQVVHTQVAADHAKGEQAECKPTAVKETPIEPVQSSTTKEPFKSSTAKEPVVSTEEVKAAHPSVASRVWSSVKPTVTPSLSNTVNFAESKAWESEAAMETDVEGWAKDFKFDSIISSFLQTVLTSSTFGLFPLLYIALGITIAAIHNKPTSNGSDGFLETLAQDAKYAAISNAITVAVTLFPIGFGLILCQLLKTSARWRAERGTQLLTLEQILASKSFGSAVQAPLKFKRINFTAIGLIILWAASPITTQALQRIFTIGQGPTPTTQLPVEVLDVSFGNSVFSGDGILMSSTVLYTASLLMPESLVNTSRTDIYGNPKLPLLSAVQASITPDGDGWYDIGSNLTVIDDASPGGAQTSWVSLVGIPISGVPPNSSAGSVYSSFNFTTGYSTFDCGPFSVVHNESTSYGHSNCLSLEAFTNSSCKSGDIFDSFEIGTSTTVNKATGQLDIIFKSRTAEYPLQYVSTTCALDLATADVVVSCAGTSCAVSKMKPSAKQPPAGPELLNMVYSFAFANPAWPVDSTGTSSTLENWLLNPVDPITALQKSGYVNVSTVPPEVFSARFSVAFNTFWQVGLGGDAFIASLPDHFEDPGLPLVQASASVYTMRPVYQCSWGWLVVLLVSCVVVIICILFEMYLATKVLGPDILGYVSTITHGGSVAAPAEAAGGSALDGAQRARLLAHAKVRLQDVQPQEPVGKIALVPGDGAPLIKGRKYV